MGLDSIWMFNLQCDSYYHITQQSTNPKLPTTISLIPPPTDLPDNLHINIISKLNDTNAEIVKLLTSYQTCFAESKFDIGCIPNAECIIELITNIPINSKPYRSTNHETINSEVQSLLLNNLIRPSYSPYASPVTLAFKKEDNAKTRFCIDYRKLNDKILPDKYPMPRIEDIIDRLHNSKCFSIFDIRSGFWHIKVRESDIPKTAFVTQNGHFEWLVMPFGLKNAPAIFQRTIRNMLEKYSLTNFCHNYMDDIIVFSPDSNTHINHLSQLLSASKKENIKLNFDKSQLFQTTVNYLGYRLSPNHIYPLNNNINSILELKPPKC